jgi:hypothetical protein
VALNAVLGKHPAVPVRITSGCHKLDVIVAPLFLPSARWALFSPIRHLAKSKEDGKDLCDKVNPAACRDVRSAEDSEPGGIFRVAANKFALQHTKADSTAKYVAQRG